LLCSRQTRTEYTLQEPAKEAHGASEEATSRIRLTTFPGRTSGAIVSSKGLPGFNFYTPQRTYYQMS